METKSDPINEVSWYDAIPYLRKSKKIINKIYSYNLNEVDSIKLLGLCHKEVYRAKESYYSSSKINGTITTPTIRNYEFKNEYYVI